MLKHTLISHRHRRRSCRSFIGELKICSPFPLFQCMAGTLLYSKSSVRDVSDLTINKFVLLLSNPRFKNTPVRVFIFLVSLHSWKDHWDAVDIWWEWPQDCAGQYFFILPSLWNHKKGRSMLNKKKGAVQCSWCHHETPNVLWKINESRMWRK